MLKTMVRNVDLLLLLYLLSELYAVSLQKTVSMPPHHHPTPPPPIQAWLVRERQAQSASYHCMRIIMRGETEGGKGKVFVRGQPNPISVNRKHKEGTIYNYRSVYDLEYESFVNYVYLPYISLLTFIASVKHKHTET